MKLFPTLLNHESVFTFTFIGGFGNRDFPRLLYETWATHLAAVSTRVVLAHTLQSTEQVFLKES